MSNKLHLLPRFNCIARPARDVRQKNFSLAKIELFAEKDMLSSLRAEAKTLLIVEDDATAREALGIILRREGYQTILAANGKEALACLEGGTRPDLVILDMLMPVLDGCGFIARLRDLPLPRIPIIVMSGIGLSEEWAKDNGGCTFLKKHIDPDELIAEVRRCLEES